MPEALSERPDRARGSHGPSSHGLISTDSVATFGSGTAGSRPVSAAEHPSGKGTDRDPDPVGPSGALASPRATSTESSRGLTR
eukprot:756500-Hanusia_phi.AAC.1